MHLETARLRLRSLEVGDIPALVAIWADPQVTRFLGGPREAEQVRQSLSSQLASESAPQVSLWPIVEKASGAVVGDCGLLPKEVDGRAEVELIYVLAADAWNRGYATEIARALCDYACRELGLKRLIALIEPEHVASARVAGNAGLKFERETIRPSGRTMHVYSIELSPTSAP